MSALPPYASPAQRIWHYTFRVICGLIFFFLIFPIIVIMPLSLQCGELLHLHAGDAAARSGRLFVASIMSTSSPIRDWQQALRNSLHDRAGGDDHRDGARHAGGDRAVAEPRAVPVGDHGDPDLADDRAADHFGCRHVFLLFAHRPAGHLCWASCMAHAALGTPFVIITVTATLVGFDRVADRAPPPRWAPIRCRPSSRCRCR